MKTPRESAGWVKQADLWHVTMTLNSLPGAALPPVQIVVRAKSCREALCIAKQSFALSDWDHWDIEAEHLKVLERIKP